MRREPLVSIVMAVRDTAPYLPGCLDSIIEQTYQNWELIAVNDHSSDASPAILLDYSGQDPRIRVFNNDRSRLIPALQLGYSKSQGVLINRMDSDDYMPAYKLEVLVTEWLKYGKGTIIVGGTRHFVDKGRLGDGFVKYDRWLNGIVKDGRFYQEIYRECVIPSHCWIIHRDDFNAVEAFDPIVYPEDYDLCFRIYRHGLAVVGVDKVLHYWRDRSDRISRTWEEYRDNRYFDLKLRYFYELDRDLARPLVIWGAGRNGKDLVRGIQSYADTFYWTCDNENKIGKNIYGVVIQHYSEIPLIEHPQIIIAVTSSKEKAGILDLLDSWNKKPVTDYWFFI